MDEYISKQSIIDYLNGYLHSIGEGGADSLLFDRGQRRALINSIQDISAVEAADVQPTKKGHWYHNTSKYISELDVYFIQACCSCCGKYSDRVDLYSTIMSNEMCSHCGAKMDGDYL